MKNNRLWNILFMGTDEVAVQTLRTLHRYTNSFTSCTSSNSVTKQLPPLISTLEVLCPPDKKTSRKGGVQPVPVKSYALEHNIMCYHTPEIRNSLKNWILPTDKTYDIGVVVSFGYKIGGPLLQKCQHGCINMHPSLLPKYRGASPIAHTLLNGEKNTGISVIDINNKFDSGSVLYQENHAIKDSITYDILSKELAYKGAQAIVKVLENYDYAKQHDVAQNENFATYAPKVKKDDGNIDWNNSALTIKRMWQAFSSTIGIRTKFLGRVIHLTKIDMIIHPREELHESRPGAFVFDKQMGCFCVKCGDGNIISVQNLKMEGRKDCDAIDFCNGFRLAGKISNFEETI